MPFADVEMLPSAADTQVEEDGCSYVLAVDRPGGPGRLGPRFCDRPRRPDSSYCVRHHAVCYLATGSPAEELRLREIEALAQAIGGKFGRDAPCPPPALLRRLEHIARAFSRPGCSRIVRKEGE